MEILKKIFKVLTNILLVLVVLMILLVIFNFFQLKILKKDCVNFFGYAIFEVASGSMEPTITTNDLIIIKITNKVKINDIITYRNSGAFITHRIVQTEGDYFITRGDANNSQDIPISTSQILGKVVKILPNLGLWKTIITTPKILISVIVTLCLFSLAFSYNGKRKCKDFGIYYNGIIDEKLGDYDDK